MKITRFICLLLSVFSLGMVQSQNLKPSIGLTALPADGDSICPIPNYLGSFDASGLQEGDTIPDFTLYDLNGNAVNIASELSAGKPILLVAGSYTCPVFRNKITDLNQVVATYPNDIKTFVIYTVEAHPNIDISPYFGFVNTGSANINAGILYRQPATYGERKAVAGALLSNMTIQAPLLIDGPCNEWWSHFGPAPNNAYLVNVDGTVFSKHGWFDKFPEDIFCDIDSILGNPNNCSGSANGTFIFRLTDNDTITGTAGTTLYGHGELINNSTDDVIIEVMRIAENLPAGWSTSMCTDICLPPWLDSTTVFLTPGDTQAYTMYFYTGQTPDSGSVRMGFRNLNHTQNRFVQWFWGRTDANLVGREEASPGAANPNIVFPNPASGELNILTAEADAQGMEGTFLLFNPEGKILRSIKTQTGIVSRISTQDLPPGLYLYRMERSPGPPDYGKVLLN